MGKDKLDDVMDKLMDLDLDDCKGTVHDHDGFSAEADAAVLRKAMKGLGTNEKKIIEVTANRSNKQRQEIKEKFKQSFGRDLMKDLESELGGHFKDLVLALYLTPAHFDAMCLHKAMKGMGTKESVLIEILASRDNKQLEKIREEYKKLYKDELEKDISSETRGDFKHILISLLQGGRSDSKEVHEGKAKEEAEALYKAGVDKVGTDEGVFNKIFCTTSYRQLRAVFHEYKKMTEKDIEKAIDKEFGGDTQATFQAVTLVAKYRPAYFAKLLFKSMKGAGTNEALLTRVMVSRSEIDLKQVETAFHAMFGKSLKDYIKGDTRGDYENMLVALLH